MMSCASDCSLLTADCSVSVLWYTATRHTHTLYRPACHLVVVVVVVRRCTAGWMIALVTFTRAVCSGELSLLSSMSVVGGGGGGEEVPADRVQADHGVGKVPKPSLTSLSKDQCMASLSSRVQPPSIKKTKKCNLYGLNLQLDNGGGSSHPSVERRGDFP